MLMTCVLLAPSGLCLAHSLLAEFLEFYSNGMGDALVFVIGVLVQSPYKTQLINGVRFWVFADVIG